MTVLVAAYEKLVKKYAILSPEPCVNYCVTFFSEATIRFLKAKLRVMQEELENTVSESRDKVSNEKTLSSVVKHLFKANNTKIRGGFKTLSNLYGGAFLQK